MEDGWERQPRVQLQRDQLDHLVDAAFPGSSVTEHEVLATGLANTNVRFRLHDDESTYVLRLHTRDPLAAAREWAVMRHLATNPAPSIPVPELLYSDPTPERGGHPYSIWRFVEGTLLQELFDTLSTRELVEIAGACGQVLASLATHRFAKCGELGPELEIVREYGSPSRFVPEVIHRALFEGLAGQRLGATLRNALWSAVDRASPALEAIDDRYTLVHADYKRSNILMRRVESQWSVAAVLDWEFACAGPPLIDVGIFLRAGERLPPGFHDAFVSCYREAGGELPADWLPLSRLVDAVSQVIFLDGPDERPRVFAESKEVVKETIRILS